MRFDKLVKFGRNILCSPQKFPALAYMCKGKTKVHYLSNKIDVAFTIKEEKLTFFILFHIQICYVGASQMHW